MTTEEHIAALYSLIVELATRVTALEAKRPGLLSRLTRRTHL